MYVPFNTSRPFFPPSYTPPLYTPIMTQTNFGPPLIRRIIIPTQINFANPQFAPIPPIPRTPLIKISPPRYKPVMTEPSDNFRRPLNNDDFPGFNKKIKFNKISCPKRVKNTTNSLNYPFIVDYSKKIGEGVFSFAYSGTFIPGNIDVAIKIQKNNQFYNYVSNEIKIYNKLNGLNGIPKIYWSGKYNNDDTIVYQKLGKSLQKDFYEKNKKYDLGKVKKIGREILDILESIHEKNIVHGDIKPGCFHFENNYNDKLYILDFGFSSEFCNSFTGKHIPFRQNISSLSDKKFCSRNICKSYQKSRRDDIESLGYILVYLLNGSLPWESNFFININQKKLTISLDELCYGLPSIIKQFIQYSWNLSFEEKPDYSYLRSLLVDFPIIKRVPSNKSISSGGFIPCIVDESDESFKQINDTEFKTHSYYTHSDIPKPDLDIIERLYIKNQYSREFNRKLRMFGPMGLNEEDIKLYDALMGVINSHKTSENFLVHRFVKNDYLECVFNFKPSNIFFNLMMIRQHIGTRKVEKGFMSCYMTETHIVEGNIQLEIKIPKGTRAYITRNIIESEIILPCNTEYEITEASIKNNIIQINAIIINYDENNTDLKSSLLRIFT